MGRTTSIQKRLERLFIPQRSRDDELLEVIAFEKRS